MLFYILIPNRKSKVNHCYFDRLSSSIFHFCIDCPWYDRGFCRHGPNCKNRHTRKVLCQNYLCGFCPEGPNCTLSHPSFELPNAGEHSQPQRKVVFVCDYCGETGHKASMCFKLPYEERQKYQNIPPNTTHVQPYNRQPLGQNQNHHYNHPDGQQGGPHHLGENQHPPPPSQPFQHDVTCFKCGERGYVFINTKTFMQNVSHGCLFQALCEQMYTITQLFTQSEHATTITVY